MARKQFFSKKIIEQIKEQISILDVAIEYGLTPIQKGDLYTLKEHDSVIIYPNTNTFFRHKNSVGGDVFAFSKEIEEIGLSFKDFYFQYLNKIDRNKDPVPIEQRPIKPKRIIDRKDRNFDLNESLLQCEERAGRLLSQFRLDDNFRNVKAFLIQTRKIAPDVVNEFIERGLIKQGYLINKEKNVIDRNRVALFLGYNCVGMLSGVNVKSTSSRGGFKGDLSGCNYAYGWRYDPDIKNYKELYQTEFYNTQKPLVCFEGYIDMLAYISTLKEKGIDYHQYAYLTCGSTTKYRSVIATVSMERYSKVICAFDNDEAGDIHAIKLCEDLKKECGEEIVVTRQKSQLKDWDEDRQMGIAQSVDRSYFKEISIDSLKEEKIDISRPKNIKDRKAEAQKEAKQRNSQIERQNKSQEIER